MTDISSETMTLPDIPELESSSIHGSDTESDITYGEQDEYDDDYDGNSGYDDDDLVSNDGDYDSLEELGLILTIVDNDEKNEIEGIYEWFENQNVRFIY